MAKKDTPAAGGDSKGKGAGDTPQVTHIVVSAKKDGFRRAGRAWSTEKVRLSLDEFTDEQVEQLASEPMLDVAFDADE